MLTHAVTTSNRARLAAGRGFSMVELIAVLVIVGIMAAVGAPAISYAQGSRQRVACRQVARDLNYARERAVATGTRTWVVFNASTDIYTMLVEVPANPGRANAVALTDPATGKAFSQALNTGDFAGVDLVSVSSGTGSEVGFDWLGKPYDSTSTLLTSAATITLSAGQSVTVEPGTGLARYLP